MIGNIPITPIPGQIKFKEEERLKLGQVNNLTGWGVYKTEEKKSTGQGLLIIQTYNRCRMIKYLYIVNTHGELHIVRYYQQYTAEEKAQLQTDVVKLCLSRADSQSAILDYEDYTVVFQKFTYILLIAGITPDENELAIMGLFRHFCQTLQQYFSGSLNDRHFSHNMDKVYMILDEMILNGYIAETSTARVLAPLQLLMSTKE